ncbi:hypothetical protein MRX96_007825 [Rhipicephalus microplus]
MFLMTVSHRPERMAKSSVSHARSKFLTPLTPPPSRELLLVPTRLCCHTVIPYGHTGWLPYGAAIRAFAAIHLESPRHTVPPDVASPEIAKERSPG